jgi:predicted amidohydrolase YtcJ
MEYPIQTAALLRPYLIEVDGEWVPGPSRGPLYFEPDVLRRTVTELDANDWQIHIHAIGDRAVRAALDAYEAARNANGSNHHRHVIAHLQLVHTDDVPRFAELDVIPNMQLQWAERDPYTMEALKRYIGKERWSRQYPARSMRDEGAFLAAGSDWPVDPSGPFDAIQQAVTRTGPFPGKYAKPLNPDEGIKLPEAIELHTTHAAFQLHQEGVTGSLEIGKDADMIQLDQDPLAVPIEEVRSTTVLRTFLEGETVYDASSVSAAVRGLLEADRRLAAIGGRRRALSPGPGCC